MARSTGMNRLGILLAALCIFWLFVMASQHYSDGEMRWKGFIEAGVIPVAFVMGIYWVIYGFVKK